jgi:hypothetical protein
MESYHNSKIKTHLCFNFISTGSCFYYDRCGFLHDIRCSSKNTIKRNSLLCKQLKKIKYNDYYDSSFNWPKNQITDLNINDKYEPCSTDNSKYKIEMSIWYYFILTCTKKIIHDKNDYNIITKKKRLQYFIELSKFHE